MRTAFLDVATFMRQGNQTITQAPTVRSLGMAALREEMADLYTILGRRSRRLAELPDLSGAAGYNLDPSDATALLRVKLIVDETAEFIDALLKGDAPEAADALGDLVYVTVGAALALGIDLPSVWDEIQRSNMAKFITCDNCHGKGTFELSAQASFFNGNDTTASCGPCHETGKVPLKDGTGKVIKPPGWTPPDIGAVLQRQRPLTFVLRDATVRADAEATLDRLAAILGLDSTNYTYTELTDAVGAVKAENARLLCPKIDVGVTSSPLPEGGSPPRADIDAHFASPEADVDALFAAAEPPGGVPLAWSQGLHAKHDALLLAFLEAAERAAAEPNDGMRQNAELAARDVWFEAGAVVPLSEPIPALKQLEPEGGIHPIAMSFLEAYAAWWHAFNETEGTSTEAEQRDAFLAVEAAAERWKGVTCTLGVPVIAMGPRFERDILEARITALSLGISDVRRDAIDEAATYLAAHTDRPHFAARDARSWYRFEGRRSAIRELRQDLLGEVAPPALPVPLTREAQILGTAPAAPRPRTNPPSGEMAPLYTGQWVVTWPDQDHRPVPNLPAHCPVDDAATLLWERENLRCGQRFLLHRADEPATSSLTWEAFVVPIRGGAMRDRAGRV